MTRIPPVPADSQTPYPIAEPAHTAVPPTAVETANGSIDQGIATARDGLATAREQVGPLAEKAKQFAKDRPWTAAALVGSIAVAVLGSLWRGKL